MRDLPRSSEQNSTESGMNAGRDWRTTVAGLAEGFARLKILRNETVTTEPEWGQGQQRTIVRFVAEKPR